MFRHLPNLLTGLRLLLAIVFFGMLSWYQYEGRGDPTFLNIAFVIYVVALFTDFLDGHLARKYHLETAFGRVVDPFVDKVLVLGSFIFFAGKNFIIPDYESMSKENYFVVKTITGVAPFMVVILLARELLVTSLRGSVESAGRAFGAQFSGKLKMVFQSVTILVILAYVNYLDWLQQHRWDRPATRFRDLCIWLTLGVTVISGLLYVQRALAMYRRSAAGFDEAMPPEPEEAHTRSGATRSSSVSRLRMIL
jgi:CDP-diacylglycerol--glycerol-3-phosphate 3-phosphatidyltransferase